MEKSKKSFITTGAMAFMTAAAIISLRGLPLMAAEEMTMFFYIAFATIFFLINLPSLELQITLSPLKDMDEHLELLFSYKTFFLFTTLKVFSSE